MPLIEDFDAALSAVEAYKPAFSKALQTRMIEKLRFTSICEDDDPLVEQLLSLISKDKVDHSIAFRWLSEFNVNEPTCCKMRDLFLDRGAFDLWARQHAKRLQTEGLPQELRAKRMNRVKPKYILRNHLAEVAIRRAEGGDFSEVHRLQKVLSRPFDERPEHAADAAFPPDWAQHLEVSCSS